MYAKEEKKVTQNFKPEGKQDNIYANTPNVIEAYWSDGRGNKITKRGPEGQPWVYMRTQNLAEGTEVTIKVYDEDRNFNIDDTFGKFTAVVGKNGIIEQRVPDDIALSSGFEDYTELYFRANTSNWYSDYYPSNSSDYLRASIVEAIPRIMRDLDMPTGARYMETWMNRPASNDASKQDPVMGLATMDYILSFQRGRDKYNEIFSRELWATANARKLLKERILQMFNDGVEQIPSTYKEEEFGVDDEESLFYENKFIPKFHKYQIQYLGFKQSQWSDELDDFYAGAGNFTFYIIPFGTYQKMPDGKIRFIMDEVGIYTGDLFDFNGGQELGFWSELRTDATKNLGGGFSSPSYGRVTNGTFRNWREKHNRGGDYYMYSDILRTKLTNPVIIDLSTDEINSFIHDQNMKPIKEKMAREQHKRMLENLKGKELQLPDRHHKKPNFSN